MIIKGLLTPAETRPGPRRLAPDLRSGAWDARQGQLRQLAELDCGHRLVIARMRRSFYRDVAFRYPSGAPLALSFRACSPTASRSCSAVPRRRACHIPNFASSPFDTSSSFLRGGAVKPFDVCGA